MSQYMTFVTPVGMCTSSRENLLVQTLLVECRRMQTRIDDLKQAPVAVDWPVKAKIKVENGIG